MPFAAAPHPLKRGALAKRFGCNIETIRYYENIALLGAPDRTQSGHRLYSQTDLALVQRLPWRAVYAAKLICPASHFCSKAIGLV